ncbi:hypothetical protein [Paenibacillus mesotrionivorans]|uniref:Uncharacterized protein n=1 Tax=Paenibacillus mesotrionivorans TaxID=3160968 RepID=A0ACC7NTF1_9BACL
MLNQRATKLNLDMKKVSADRLLLHDEASREAANYLNGLKITSQVVAGKAVAKGFDVQSNCGMYVGEVYTAVAIGRHGAGTKKKIRNDLNKLASSDASSKYFFVLGDPIRQEAKSQIASDPVLQNANITVLLYDDLTQTFI